MRALGRIITSPFILSLESSAIFHGTKYQIPQGHVEYYKQMLEWHHPGDALDSVGNTSVQSRRGKKGA